MKSWTAESQRRREDRNRVFR